MGCWFYNLLDTFATTLEELGNGYTSCAEYYIIYTERGCECVGVFPATALRMKKSLFCLRLGNIRKVKLESFGLSHKAASVKGWISPFEQIQDFWLRIIEFWVAANTSGYSGVYLKHRAFRFGVCLWKIYEERSMKDSPENYKTKRERP